MKREKNQRMMNSSCPFPSYLFHKFCLFFLLDPFTHEHCTTPLTYTFYTHSSPPPLSTRSEWNPISFLLYLFCRWLFLPSFLTSFFIPFSTGIFPLGGSRTGLSLLFLFFLHLLFCTVRSWLARDFMGLFLSVLFVCSEGGWLMIFDFLLRSVWGLDEV